MKRDQLYLSTMDGEAWKTAHRLGLGLEIAEYSTAWNLDRERETTHIRVTRELAQVKRATFHGPYSELFPCAVDPMIRQVALYRYRQALAAAGQYGIHRVIFHGGYDPKLYFPCWYEEQSGEFWKAFGEEIPEDMTVCLENVLEETPEMLGRIVRAADSPRIRMCLDIGHAHAYSQVPAAQWLTDCKDIISHFHIHNNDGTKDSHNPLPEGTLPMEEILEAMEQLCPQATVTLETEHGESSVQWLLEKKILEEETWN